MPRNVSDASTWLDEITQELTAAWLRCVWTQWGLLGGTAGGARPTHPVAAIDPEALLLASLDLLDAEPRLADVLRGWLRANAPLVSVQRLRNLATTRSAFATSRGAGRLAWLAEVARVEAKDARWRLLARSTTSGEEFAPPTRGKSPPPPLRPTEGHHLLLRLRLGFGVGVKADVLALSLSRLTVWSSIREVATTLGYSNAPVRRALDDLATGGFLDRRPGHPVRYRADVARWESLLGAQGLSVGWGEWDARFRFAANWIAWAEASARHPASAYALSVQARALLATHLDDEGIALMIAAPEEVLARVRQVVRDVARVMRAVEVDARGWCGAPD